MTYRTTRQCDLDIIGIHRRGLAMVGVEFSPPVRRHAYRAHMIVDVIEAEDILIIRVLQGRQDWERHLA